MSTKDRIDRESGKDPATLEREIDQQRSEIDDTLDALAQRFSPGELIDQGLRLARGHGGEFFNNLGNSIKANPVPTVLTSIGLLWMMVGQRRQPAGIADYDTEAYGGVARTPGTSRSSRLQEGAAHLKERAGAMRTSTSQSLHDRQQRLSEGAHRSADSARYRARRARDGFTRMTDEQPLALGAIGIAVGAALGAALPPTQREDQLLGSRSDRMKDKASHLAHDEYDRARATGSEVGKDLDQRMSATTESHDSDRSTGTASGPPNTTGNDRQSMPQPRVPDQPMPPPI